jgi:hypothetical protein
MPEFSNAPDVAFGLNKHQICMIGEEFFEFLAITSFLCVWMMLIR